MAKIVTTSQARNPNTDAKYRGKARTEAYVRLLSRKAGITAEALRAAVGAITKHNSYSLALLAAKTGFQMINSDDAASGLKPTREGLKRYAFIALPSKTAAITPAITPASKTAAAAAVITPATKTGKAIRKANKG